MQKKILYSCALVFALAVPQVSQAAIGKNIAGMICDGSIKPALTKVVNSFISGAFGIVSGLFSGIAIKYYMQLHEKKEKVSLTSFGELCVDLTRPTLKSENVAGFCGGAICGAIGMWAAYKFLSIDETAEEIKKTKDELSQKIQDEIDKLKELLKSSSEEIKKLIEDKIKNLEEMMSKIANANKEDIKKLTDDFEKFKNDILKKLQNLEEKHQKTDDSVKEFRKETKENFVNLNKQQETINNHVVEIKEQTNNIENKVNKIEETVTEIKNFMQFSSSTQTFYQQYILQNKFNDNNKKVISPTNKNQKKNTPTSPNNKNSSTALKQNLIPNQLNPQNLNLQK